MTTASTNYIKKQILFNKLSQDWINLLDVPLLDKIIKQLNDIPDPDTITPRVEHMFEFARLTPLNNIKVVILGQDPYPKKGDAHGLAFSCMGGIPASLANIYKCLVKQQLIKKQPTTGNLTKWAEQGVLLLNTALTTIIGAPNSHSKMWKMYTMRLIKKLSNGEYGNSLPVFMLWGNYAKKMTKIINSNCSIVSWAHPSPLASHKQSFLDCDNFTKANQYLIENKKEIVDWNVEEPEQTEIEKRFKISKDTVVVFTDGSCYPNRTCSDAVAGYSSVFVLGNYADVVLYGNIQNRPNYATNQRAEGYAIYVALKYLNENKNWKRCVFVSDTEFWIKMFEIYMPGWDQIKKDFKEKKNSDLTIDLWKLYNDLLADDKEIEFRHVKSHNKNGWGNQPEHTYEYFCWFNNDYADQMAKYARLQLKPGQHIVSTVEYEKE